jgi:tRNA modification GTPase
VAEQVNQLVINLTALLAQAEQGRRLQSGLKVALIGPPNAGKSSILNRLTGDDSAIVTNIPGTTRDVVKEQILIDGLPLVISDTAGIRKASDAIEAVGIERSWQVAEAADVSLIVFDATDHEILANKDNDRSFDQAIKTLQKQLFGERPAPAKAVVVLNKMDALSATEQQQINQRARPKGAAVLVSAKTGESWQTLLDAIKAMALDVDIGESVFSARARHIVALKQAQRYLAAAKDLIEAKHPGELVAEELKMAQETLGEITGKVTSDELLGKIFGSFCIGK